MNGQKAKHILLIDDNMTDLRSIHQLLVHIGYNVTPANDPLKALNFFREEPDKFHLIITDQFMPGLKGQELIIQARQIREDIPVILCSGSEEAIQELQEQREVNQRFLPKPFSRSELEEAIQDVLVS
jgi:CheY-like chemotaxis protein